MKKLLVALLVVLALSLCMVSTVYAGGDQARGEKGQGAVNQVQVMDPPPFEP